MVFTFNLFIFSSMILGKNEVDMIKAVLIFLPIVFSQAGRSAAALELLGAGSFSFNPLLQIRFPQENWDQLFSVSYEACKSAIAAEGDNLGITAVGDNGTSSRGSGLGWLLQVVRIILELILGTFSIHL